ncbi:hypothetical protein HDU67_008663 [Dinochytrium kinnereticum]|nr:hypothetical protein HDU67_008663 [Dinochytrium kinnereticum]
MEDHVLAVLVEMFGDSRSIHLLQKVAMSSDGKLESAIQTVLDHREDMTHPSVSDTITMHRTTSLNKTPNAFAVLKSGRRSGIVDSGKPRGEKRCHPLTHSKPGSLPTSTRTASLSISTPPKERTGHQLKEADLDVDGTVGRDSPSAGRNALALLKWPPEAQSRVPPPPHIQLTPENVRDHIPCELFLNFLPEDLSDAVLSWLMKEADEWERPNFIINDKEVRGNHKTEIFVENPTQSYSWAGEENRRIRQFNPLLAAVRDLVQERVRELGVEGWTSNAVVVNEYRNGKEITGAHTDKVAG